MSSTRTIFRVFVAAALVLTALSGRAEISLTSRVDPTTITIGDSVVYSVIVTHDDSTVVEFPSLGANLGAFEIRNFTLPRKRKEGGLVVEQVDYVLSTFDVGDFEIPPTSIRYRSVRDTVWSELRSQPLKIHVASLNPDLAGDILDIEAPLEIPFDWMRVVRWLIVGVFGLAALLFALHFVRRRRRGAALLPGRGGPPRPAHEVALEELDHLFHSDLLQRGEIKLFHIRLSEIVRAYIEGRFGTPALEMTSTEILEALADGQLDEADRETLRRFLDACDLVKFAKYLPDKEEIDETVQRAYAFVNSTMPRPEVVEEETGESEAEEPAAAQAAAEEAAADAPEAGESEEKELA